MPEVLEQEPQEMENVQEDSTESDPLANREDLQQALKELVIRFYKYDAISRRQEVMDTRKQRFYWRDVQYIWWNEGKGAFFSAPQAGMPYTYQNTSIEMPRYCDVYNVFTPCAEIILSAFTQNPPGVRFQAADPKEGQDIAAKVNAEKYRHYFDRQNDNKKLQQDIGRFYLLDSRVVTVTRFDEQKGHTVTRAFGTLESKVAIQARHRSETPYCFIQFEREACDAKAEHPEFADKIKAGTCKIGSDYEHLARLGVLQGGSYLFASESEQHLVTESWCWLRKSAFAELEKQTSSGAPASLKDKKTAEELAEMFPDGCYVQFEGDTYVLSRSEDMDSHVEISFPSPGDGMSRPSMMHKAVPVQDNVNDSMNLWKEVYDFTIPVTWMNTDWADIQALRMQMSEPGNHLPFKTPPGTPMQDNFFREPPSEVSGDFIQYLEMITGNLLQFITGAVASLFGGSMEDQKTARGYSMARDQAMGRLGIAWGALQRHFASIYQQAVAEEAKHREGEINVEIPGQSGESKVDSLDFGALGSGNVLCYPDTDSSFPETFSAKRQSFMQFIQLAGPAAMQMINTPNNLEVTRDMIGLEELEIPGQEACEKQRAEITVLLQESTVPEAKKVDAALMATAAASATGQQPPEVQPEAVMQSTVEVDPIFDLHQFEFQEVQRWLNSPDGRRMKSENPSGWANVRQHGLEHKEIMDQQAAQQAMQAMAGAAAHAAPPHQQPQNPPAHPAQGAAA